jgi:hypothetical protein
LNFVDALAKLVPQRRGDGLINVHRVQNEADGQTIVHLVDGFMQGIHLIGPSASRRSKNARTARATIGHGRCGPLLMQKQIAKSPNRILIAAHHHIADANMVISRHQAGLETSCLQQMLKKIKKNKKINFLSINTTK